MRWKKRTNKKKLKTSSRIYSCLYLNIFEYDTVEECKLRLRKCSAEQKKYLYIILLCKIKKNIVVSEDIHQEKDCWNLTHTVFWKITTMAIKRTHNYNIIILPKSIHPYLRVWQRRRCKSRGTLRFSGPRSRKRSAGAAIRRRWPAAAVAVGNDYDKVAAHLAGPARKTSSSRAVSLLQRSARDGAAFESKYYNRGRGGVWIEIRRRRQNDFTLRPAMVPAISATDRWSRDAHAIYWESCTRVRLWLLLLRLLLLLLHQSVGPVVYYTLYRVSHCV